VEGRNKEINYVNERLEELAYRRAGQFNKKEQKALYDIFNIGRDTDSYSRGFRPSDDASLKEFLGTLNSFDDRIKIMEMWLARKELEFNQRVNLATPELAQSDQTLFQYQERRFKPARERLLE
jgi:hypothetical protein